jgi:tRNA-uridine 2-sulfurtransferase
MENKHKIFVAMSGGVDSSVAAHLLKKQGHDVVGVFMKNWTETLSNVEDNPLAESELCPWITDQEDMRKVCNKLHIPFYTFDFEKEYKDRVIEYFYSSYKKGITPNPDIMCNKEIKFNLFLKKCIKLGADYIATGHYAQVRETTVNGNRKFELLKGKDENKDQSYFLCTLNQEQLSKTLFPIGEYKKTEIRKIAKKINLPTHDKKDSQGICFIGEVDLREFLKQRLKENPGKIITTEGELIGDHVGLPFYTIGQRKGINIGGGIPYYVVGKDSKNNQLVVAKGSHDPKLFNKNLSADHVHWVGEKPRFPLKCTAKIRYRQVDQKVTINQLSKNTINAVFDEPQRAITPGQSIVMYEGDILIGSAVIA